MGINTVHDLFVYELGLVREVEAAGTVLFEFMFHKVGNEELKVLIRSAQEGCQQWRDNVSSCLRAFGSEPVAAPSETVNGIYRGFEEFIRLQPSPDMTDQFAADAGIRFLRLAITTHQTLIDWAIMLNESQCIKHLYANLVHKRLSVANLERFSHDLGSRLLTMARARAS